MSRVKIQELQRASARLGEAVLDPELWPQLMDEISRATSAIGAGLLQSDIRSPDIPRTDEVDDMISSYFRNGWQAHDLRSSAGFPLLLGGAAIVTDEDVVTPEQMHSSSFYNESLYPFGLQWFAAIGFRSGSALWALSLQRTTKQGPFLKQEKRLLAGLSQHLTEVATLSNAVGRAALLGSTNALGAVQHPAVAIDHFGFALEANSAMGTVYDDELRIRDKRLWVADPAAKLALERLIEQLTTSTDRSTLACEPIVIKRTGKHPVILRVLPVPPAARSPFFGARAIFTFTAIEPKARPDTALLAQIFGLTPAEARLATILADGTSIDAAAETLSIKRETARNQLKSVFLKTGTHRQSQLVALLARL